jgi:hypothetical protein
LQGKVKAEQSFVTGPSRETSARQGFKMRIASNDELQLATSLGKGK